MSTPHRSFWLPLLGAGILLAGPAVLAQPGHGRILACLAGKTDELSQACKDDVSKKLTALYKACKADTEKLCPGVEMGGGRLLQCLGDNDTALSSSCKKVWGKPKSKKKTASAN